jgi:hypothetical protein
VIRRVRRNVGSDHVLGNVAVRGREVPSIFGNYALDRPRLAQLLHLRPVDPRVSKSSCAVPEGELHHPVGAGVREGIDQDAVDDAEHGAGRADAERQRKNRRRGEARPSAQFPRGIAEIGDE